MKSSIFVAMLVVLVCSWSTCSAWQRKRGPVFFDRQELPTSNVYKILTRSGEYVTISSDNKVLLTGDVNQAHKFLTIIPCIANDKEGPCVSFMSYEKPGWYLRHADLDLWLESEGDSRASRVFKEDASFYLRKNKFVEGWASFESYNSAGHFIVKDNTKEGLYIHPAGSSAGIQSFKSSFIFVEQ